MLALLAYVHFLLYLCTRYEKKEHFITDFIGSMGTPHVGEYGSQEGFPV